MMMPTVVMVVMVAVAAVSAAFGLEGGLHLHKIRSEAMEHILDHVVGPNAKNLVSNFSRQMPISQMPGKAHELIGIFMPDFDNRAPQRPEPSATSHLQVASHLHRPWQPLSEGREGHLRLDPSSGECGGDGARQNRE